MEGKGEEDEVEGKGEEVEEEGQMENNCCPLPPPVCHYVPPLSDALVCNNMETLL